MLKPLFSIVIPAYNRAGEVVRAIRSCQAQSCQDFEILVIDDEKSTDQLEDAVAALQDARIRVVSKHRGRAAAARNTGMRLARGRYVALLDSDDQFLPDKLEVYRRRLASRPDALLYSQNYVDRGVGRYWIKPARGLGQDEDLLDYLFVEKGWIHTSTVVLLTEVARAMPYREDLSFGDDMQFAYDLWLKGVRFSLIEQPLSLYDDRRAPERLSQTPIFKPGATPEHESFIGWVESLRPRMSRRAEAAWEAHFLSRLVAPARPGKALGYIWQGFRSGALSGRAALQQTVQTFAPEVHRRLADWMVRTRGEMPGAIPSGGALPIQGQPH